MTRTMAYRRERSAAAVWWSIFAILLILVIAAYMVKLKTVDQVITVEDAYSVEGRVERANVELSKHKREAGIVNSSARLTQKMELLFEGTPENGMLDQLLTLLDEYGIKATFFISAQDALNEPDSVRRILSDGHMLGSGGNTGTEHMESLPQSEIINDLCRASATLHEITGVEPITLKYRETAYTPAVLQAAYACGLGNVYDTPYIVDQHSFRSYQEVEAYVNERSRGSMIAIRMSGEASYSSESGAQALLNLAGGVSEEMIVNMDALSENERVLTITEWFLRSLNDTEPSPEAIALKEKNGGVLAEKTSLVYTTQRAVSYLFSGLGNVQELNYLLSTLNELQIKSTFFITLEEAQAYTGQVEQILAQGHELGIAIPAATAEDYYASCSAIRNCQRYLKERYAYHNAYIVKQLVGNPTDSLLEAVHATGCELVSYSVTAVQLAGQEATDLSGIPEKLEAQFITCFRRGELVYFTMNYYTKSTTLLGDMVKYLHQNMSIYEAKPVSELLENTKQRYTYPLPAEDILPALTGVIKPGHLSGANNDALMQHMLKHYLGTDYVVNTDTLPGFTASEARQMDSAGKIRNQENAIFLTFDDWGSDRAITPLLDVLEKHGAKATFFVRTVFTTANPSLLRAIALGGHDLASHTDTHYPLAMDEDGNGVYEELPERELKQFQEDLVASYDTLLSMAGDVAVNGRAAITANFRPPTLAVSRRGAWAVFDAGFNYIVSGAYSSHDYAAKSAKTLYQDLKANSYSGAVIVMHMSDNCLYTAEALDMLLTENEKRPESKRFVTRRISDYLNGTYEVNE